MTTATRVAASDCYVDLRDHKVLNNQFDNIAGNGNVVQCGEVGNLGADTTFTVALGYGSDAASAVAAANGSLAAGFTDREAAYRGGWNNYLARAAPSACQRVERTPCVAAPTTSGRWPCTPLKTRRSAVPASRDSQRRGVTSRMGTTSTTATTGCGVATCISRPWD